MISKNNDFSASNIYLQDSVNLGIMTFDNKKKAIKLRFSSFLMVVATIVLILIVIYTDITEPLYSIGLTRNMVIAVIAGALVLTGVWRYMLDLHYVYFSDDEPSITIRYSSLRPFTTSKNAIVIEKERFEGFEIRRYLFGLKPYLVLAVSNNFNKIVKYPPISISGLNKKQRYKLIHALKKY